MRLILNIKSFCDQPASDPQSRAFDVFPVTLGRCPTSDYRLNDPSQHVSSNHAVITWENDHLIIHDNSSNGLFINGVSRAVGRGASVSLRHKDTLELGDFTLYVAIEQTSVDHESIAMHPYTGKEHFGKTWTTSHDDPFKKSEPSYERNMVSGPSSAGSWSTNNHDTPDQLDSTIAIPAQLDLHSNSDNSDAWADWADWTDTEKLAPQVRQAIETVQRHEPDAFNENKDDALGWLPRRHHAQMVTPDEQASDWLSGENREPAIHSEVVSDSHRALRVSNMKQHVAAPFTTRNATDSDFLPGHGLPSELQSVAGREPANSSQPLLNANSTSSSEQARKAATMLLLHAANLEGTEISDGNDTEILENAGELLSQMVDAMMVLLRSRAELKNYICSDSTQLAKVDNNPLKFSLSTSDALSKLLASDTEGFLPSALAVEEAVADLKSHQLAMLESTEITVKSMLSHFNPENLEKEIEKSGGISATIRIAREAKLWRTFCQRYRNMEGNTSNDFENLFGAEFRKAYEKSIKEKALEPASS